MCVRLVDELEKEIVEEAEADGSGAEIKFMPCAVSNLTEFPLRFTSRAGGGSSLADLFTAGTDVKPLTTVAFETAEQAAKNREAEVTGGLSHLGDADPAVARGVAAVAAITSNCESRDRCARRRQGPRLPAAAAACKRELGAPRPQGEDGAARGCQIQAHRNPRLAARRAG